MILQDLAKAYRFTAEEVGNMTLYQIRCYLTNREAMLGTVSDEHCDVELMRERLKDKAWMARFLGIIPSEEG